MGNIEDTQPISVLAERVWAGTHWHYPHIEKMCKEMRELREAVRVLAETICKVGFADQCEPHCNTRSVVEGRKCSCGGERRCKRKMEKMWANQIAAAAVREAGR